MIDVKELREAFSILHTAAVKYADDFKDKDETDAGKTEQAARFSQMDKMQKQLDEAERLAKYSFESKSATVITPTPSQAQAAVEAHDAGTGEFKLDAVKFSKEVGNWAAGKPMDQAYATITTATQSGVFLPKEVTAPIIPTGANTFRDAINIQDMASVSIVSTPTSGALSVPVITGTAGGQVAENAASETDGTPGLTESIDLTVKTYQSGSVYYSNQLLAAGTVDLVNGVVPVLAYEKELGLESQIVTTMKADSGITQAVTLAAATLASITFAKMQLLNRALPKRFDSKKVILLADDSFSAMEALVDSNGRPLLAQDTQNQELKRFLGTPVLRCSYFDAMAGAKVIGAIISLLGFRLRDVDGANLAKYDQVPAKPNQVGFNLFSYHGYGYADSACALLKTP